MDLQTTQGMNMDVIELSNNYQVMLKEISNYYPVLEKATSNFNKSQSQFMNNMLTVSHPTELRNARQILAEVERTRQALDEAYFNIRKKQIEIKKKELQLKDSIDLDYDLLFIEILELKSQIKSSSGYVEGAIRKISAYVSQYKQILTSMGKEDFTEEDFEKDEERYHIQKMFEQGLCAARSNGGRIDEGNQIYAHQIGINGTAAQEEVNIYLTNEITLIQSGGMPSHSMTINWLRSMADKYEGCAIEYAFRKGMMLLDTNSLHKEEE